MPLTNDLAAAVTARGGATLDDLSTLFPHLTRDKLQKGLQNAREAGLIRQQVRGIGGRWGGKPGVWAAVPAGEVIRRKAKKTLPPLEPVASVFELAHKAPWQGTWPPGAAGTVVSRLGSWDAPE